LTNQGTAVREPALAKLYEVLNTAQKKNADEILTSIGCMM